MKNKTDLLDGEEIPREISAYESIGYAVLRTCARTGATTAISRVKKRVRREAPGLVKRLVRWTLWLAAASLVAGVSPPTCSRNIARTCSAISCRTGQS